MLVCKLILTKRIEIMKKYNQKGFAHLLLLALVILVVIGSGMFVLMNHSKSTNKTNTNNSATNTIYKANKITLDMPQNLKKQECTKDGVATLLVTDGSNEVPDCDITINNKKSNYLYYGFFCTELNGKTLPVLGQPVTYGSNEYDARKQLSLNDADSTITMFVLNRSIGDMACSASVYEKTDSQKSNLTFEKGIYPTFDKLIEKFDTY